MPNYKKNTPAVLLCSKNFLLSVLSSNIFTHQLSFHMAVQQMLVNCFQGSLHYLNKYFIWIDHWCITFLTLVTKLTRYGTRQQQLSHSYALGLAETDRLDEQRENIYGVISYEILSFSTKMVKVDNNCFNYVSSCYIRSQKKLS